MNKLLLLTTSILLGFSFSLNAQTNLCNNGIDDDHDGFIDCFDPDRDGGVNCDCDGYIGDDANCQVEPGKFPEFSMTLDFASPDETVTNLSRIAIGDLDRDGMPEIVTTNTYNKTILVLNGNDGSVKHKLTVSWYPRYGEALIGNLNDDKCGEIFIWGQRWENKKGGGGYWQNFLVAYDCSLNEIWSDDVIGDPGSSGLADFNRDGTAELYSRNEIRDAATGTVIVKGSNWSNLNSGPVAVDMMNDEDLELVIGGKIYGVDMGNGSANSGSLTLEAEISDYYVRNSEGDATSIADYNLDGYLDVIAVGSDGGKNKNTTIFYWDVHNDVVKKFIDKRPDEIAALTCNSNSSPDYLYKNGWTNGAGRVNIADLDGDGKLNASFISGKYMYALDENFNQLWAKPLEVFEQTSGFTGCTLFDFNGDGKSEVVYRDEENIYIIDGTDGTIRTSQPCRARTNREYPIVADVDADGSTEICVPCATDDGISDDFFCDLTNSKYSQVRIYKSNGEPWVPARRVWNQHGYFNVNINDDLTIPKNIQKHHLVWSTGNCTEGPNRPLNKFLNQSPYLNTEGCPTYKAPNLAFDQSGLTISQPTCPDRNFTVTFDITNIGDASLSGLLPVSFYNGDPMQSGASILGTEYFDVSNLKPGGKISVSDLTLTGPGSDFKLYIVLNDNGSTVPSPITLPNSNFLECDYVDNVLTGNVVPLPFVIETESTPNKTCNTGATIPNGSARAWRPVGATEETADYIFDWYAGTDLTASPVYSGAVFSGLEAGTYTVVATHKTAGCSSSPVEVTIGEEASAISAEIIVEKNVTDCKKPNGKLNVVVNGGDPYGKFTYQWYEGNTVGTGPVIGTSHVITNLKATAYAVIVTDKATGCTTIQSENVAEDVPPIPDPELSITDITCTSANAGEVEIGFTGNVDDYTYEWSEGNVAKPTPDYSGTHITGLSEGTYILVMTDKKTKCTAETTFAINQTLPPVIDGVTALPQTSCNPGASTGSATVQYSGTSSYLVEWFAGQNTLPANKKGEGNTLSGQPKGIYTVKLTDLATTCYATAEVTIKNKIVIPTLTATATEATTCVPTNGSITAVIQINGTDVSDLSDYTFFWYNGTSVKATPDYAEESNVLSGITPGDYTVYAVNNVSGCEVAAAKTVTVNDNTPVLDIIQTPQSLIPPSDCNSGGSIEVKVTKAGDPGAVFTINWYEGVAPFTAAPIQTTAGVSTDLLSDVPAGVYSAEAIDPVSGCSSIHVFTLEFVQLHTIAVTPVNATQCEPINGGLEITLDGKTLDEADFIMEVYEGANASGPVLETIAGISDQTVYQTASTYDTKQYTVVAINTLLNNCRSIPKSATIGSDATSPALSLVGSLDNTACSGSPFNGSIDIDIDGGASASNYTIEWFEGQNASTSPALGTNVGAVASGGLRAEQLSGGVYLVKVTNGLGCETTLTTALQDDAPIVNIAVTPAHITSCDAMGNLTTGSAHAQAQDEGTDVGGYNYTWTDASGATLGNGQDIAGLTPGTYYVSVFNGFNGCGSTTEFIIEDETVNDPSISLVGYEEPTRCLQTANLTGYVEIDVTGSSAAGFDIIWREDDASGAEVISARDSKMMADLINTANFNVDQKSYHVTVINRDTQCRDTDLYTLNREVYPVILTASASDVTVCDENNPDGMLFAIVTSGGESNYDYQWSNAGGNLFNGRNYPNVGPGDYTVTATDLADNFCIADTSLLILEDQVMPQLMVNKLSPNHACVDSLADGVARARVNGEYVGYTFEWYEGTDINVTPVYTGSEFFGMKAMTYTVVVTDNINKCTSLASVTIDQETLDIPEVTAVVLADQTSCGDPNGIIAANVNGNTTDYIFDWYIGASVKNSPDFTGPLWTGVDAGEYTVTATNMATGCVAGPETVTVIEDLQYPDFTFDITNPNCDDDNGFVKFDRKNGVSISKITWTGEDGSVYEGPYISQVPAGVYEVTATTVLGCSATKTIELLSDIDPFNGISRNGDNRNDYFKIGCITDYPQNMVKIFNRAGTLVYEMEGYDNATKFFDGTSNKGISLMGFNLPDGTYYYVIDKQDGTKPVAGYLEIVQ